MFSTNKKPHTPFHCVQQAQGEKNTKGGKEGKKILYKHIFKNYVREFIWQILFTKVNRKKISILIQQSK